MPVTIGIGPLDMRRLAVRIETLVNADRQGWHAPDLDLFRQKARTLPNPQHIRDWAHQWEVEGSPPNGVKVIRQQYNGWLGTLLDMEQISGRNQPYSLRRAIRTRLAALQQPRED
jgi:hypothetical protein